FWSAIDRVETMADYGKPQASKQKSIGSGSTPFMFHEPGANVGPKTSDLWKPVIAAVNGIACGGAFYMLGEVEFIIAAEHATFFDPHVTYGMTAAFEPMHMSGIMPFPEIMRVSLLGNHERLTARRAHERRHRRRRAVGRRAGRRRDALPLAPAGREPRPRRRRPVEARCRRLRVERHRPAPADRGR